ncbi:MAG: response regulator transcription factor [Patulibacter sp.]
MSATGSRAWVIGTAGDLLAATDRGLAQLGIQPHYLTPEEFAARTDGERERPGLIVLIDDVERTAERLAADPELGEVPAIVIADSVRLATGGYTTAGHELIVHPFHHLELETRIARARRAVQGPTSEEVIVNGTLELNTATYQVKIDGQPVDFTYMEYELLKFFVTNPDRVFTREALLANVWGYDYYGGARTVDVHIRRLRAKLGHEHAARIRTLRSVGYRWDSRPGH